ncbi:MAG: hypothetical protein WD425_21385 [Nitrospirales bacterium]
MCLEKSAHKREVEIRRLVESVPNFSEGCDQAVITTLIPGMKHVPCEALLDVHVDPDQHRSILRMVGRAGRQGTALFGFVRQAQELIGIRQHLGEHPRIGAVGVVSLCPLQW